MTKYKMGDKVYHIDSSTDETYKVVKIEKYGKRIGYDIKRQSDNFIISGVLGKYLKRKMNIVKPIYNKDESDRMSKVLYKRPWRTLNNEQKIQVNQELWKLGE
tara:strand:+ start:1886 stop:2194 length:309 start_codon:yes stop_codon:yes gene_type:complete